MVLVTSLLNTQHYKVRIKGKMEQSRKRSDTLPIGVVAIEKCAFGSLSTTVAHFIYIYLYIYIYIYIYMCVCVCVCACMGLCYYVCIVWVTS